MNPFLQLMLEPILIFAWTIWLVTRHSYGFKEALTRIAYVLAGWFVVE